MYIVDQDRSNVVNIGNIKSIALNGKRITADDYTLAAYDTEQVTWVFVQSMISTSSFQ